MQQIFVDKDAVARFQQDMLSADLIIQNAVFRRGDLKIGMSVQRTCPVGQRHQLIMKIGDRKFYGIMRYIFSQLMIKDDRHAVKPPSK